MSQIHGSWPTALGIVPELVTLASPAPSNRMSFRTLSFRTLSFRTQDLLLLVVLALFCACVKGLQGLPFPGCHSQVGVQDSQYNQIQLKTIKDRLGP